MFGPFPFTTNYFRDTMLSKFRNAPNDLRLTLNTQQSKVSLYNSDSFKAQILVNFAVRPAVFKIEGRKSEILVHQMTSEWP